MISVLIVDDHRVVAEGLSKLIDETEDVQVLDIACTLSEAEHLLEVHQPQVVLLDVALPDGDGIDAIPRFGAISPSSRFIICTSFAESAVIQRAMHGGAHGYILKSTGMDELLQGIRKVAESGSYICEEAAALVDDDSEVPPTLTMREREILQLMVEGYTIKEISDKLCLAFETVHSYTKCLRSKLGCGNTASLVRTAIMRHLV